GLAVEVKTLSTEPGGGTDLAARTGTISPDGRLATVCPGLSGHLILLIAADRESRGVAWVRYGPSPRRGR
ncbi:MAG: hypothetical protein V2A79_12265, partial [Planctomycetota bacterium]